MRLAPSISFDVAISSSWLTCCVLSSDKCIKRPSGMNDLRPFERKYREPKRGGFAPGYSPLQAAEGRLLNLLPAFRGKNSGFRCCCQEMPGAGTVARTQPSGP